MNIQTALGNHICLISESCAICHFIYNIVYVCVYISTFLYLYIRIYTYIHTILEKSNKDKTIKIRRNIIDNELNYLKLLL